MSHASVKPPGAHTCREEFWHPGANAEISCSLSLREVLLPSLDSNPATKLCRPRFRGHWEVRVDGSRHHRGSRTSLPQLSMIFILFELGQPCRGTNCISAMLLHGAMYFVVLHAIVSFSDSNSLRICPRACSAHGPCLSSRA